MNVGILPAPGSGLLTMAANGQLSRLTRHFQAYLDRGHTLRYFSSLPNDPEWIGDVWMPKRRPIGLKRAILGAAFQREVRRCDAIRATSLIGTLPAVMVRLAWGTPFVVSCGSDYAAIARIHGRPTLRWSVIHALAARFAAAIIVPNAEHAKRLSARYPHAVIAHLPNWVDTELFAPRPSRVTFPTILYVGRLVKEKNLERLARVCKGIDADLVCVGAGPLRDDLVALGAKCPGAVEWTDLPRFYANAHVFCLPSFTEGHPKALLEAMASGLPCVTSSTIDGITGPRAVFPPEDDEQLRRTLLQVLGDAGLRKSLGEGARQDAMHYDIRRVLPEEVKLVEGVR